MQEIAKVDQRTRVEQTTVDLVLHRLFNADNVPPALIESVRQYQHQLLNKGITQSIDFNQAVVNECRIDIGNMTLALQSSLAKNELANRISQLSLIDTSHAVNPGQLNWQFTGNNQFNHITIRIEERTWEVEFARLQRPIHSQHQPYKPSLKTQAHQKIYQKLCDALKPIEQSTPAQTVLLQGPSGLGKTHCAQYYFYHQARQHHQMVAWLSGHSKEAFLNDWQALAQQLRNIDSFQLEQNDESVIRNWCENQLGQWLFIIDDVNVDAAWLREKLPRQGGHILVTTSRLDYLFHPTQTTLPFPPLTEDDSRQLLHVYEGEYWQATGYPEEEKAINYLSKALGGSPVALTQIALLVRKKSLSFQRVMEQFEQPALRTWLLTDTVFEQLKGKTFLAAVQKNWNQLIRYLVERYPHVNQSKHEQQLTGFINHLQQEMKIPLAENIAEIQIPNAAVQTYWEEVWATTDIVFSEVELQTCLSYLSLSYDVGTNQWQLSLAGLSALVLQTHTDAGFSHRTNFSHQLVTNNTNQLNQYVSQNNEASFLTEHVSTISLTEPSIRKDIPTKIPSTLEKLNMPTGMNFTIRLEDASLKHTEITILAVGKPSEFSVWQLPTINPYFIPRPTLTQALAEKLPQRKIGEASAQLLLTAAATGMGGIGKTELARHFITNPELSSHYQRRFWFTATTESQLRIQFYQLALYLGLINSKKYIEDKELIAHIHKWLSVHPGWLVVLDNADDYNSIAPWIPKEGGAVLVTTREPTPGVLSSEQIVPVPLLTPEEATEWLYQLSGRNSDHATEQEKGAVENLVKGLGYLPLAIAQAAAYLREQSTLSIEDYYHRFISLLTEPSLAKQEGLQNDTDAYSRKVVASTWILSLRAIEGAAKVHNLMPLAQPLLVACAYLAPKNIPVFFLEAFLKKIYQIEPNLVNYLVDDYIGQLARYSLLERINIDNTVSMHTLMQEVIINALPDNERQARLVDSIEILKKIFPYQVVEQLEDYDKQRMLLPHLVKGLDWVKKWLKRYKKESLDKGNLIRITSIYEKELLAPLLELSAHGYDNVGDVRQAKNFLEQALWIEEKRYGKGHPGVATTLINLGCAYGNLGDAERAKRLLEQALLIEEQHYGKDHPGVAKILTNLGAACGDLGDAEQAKQLLERALLFDEKHYGLNHPEIAKTLMRLGAAYGDLGDAKQKKELLERALQINEQHYGKDHPEVASNLSTLGNAYGALGDSQQKKKLLERALSIEEMFYGKNHPVVAKTLANLGNAYGALGDAKQKKELLKRALQIEEQHYSPDHLEIAKTIANLGAAYGDLGDAQQKKELLERALPIIEKYYGKDHLAVGKIIANLGTSYGDLGDAKQKKELLERALPIIEKCYGKDHPEVAKILANLGAAYSVLGDAEQAKQLLEQALHIEERFYGKDHPEVTKLLVNLAASYKDLNDIKQTKQLLKRALVIKERYYGNNDPEIAITLYQLADVYAQEDKWYKAEKIAVRAYRILATHPDIGLQHPDTLEVENLLEIIFTFIDSLSLGPEGYIEIANSYFKENKLDKAILYYEKALESNFCIKGIYHNLACSYHIKGNVEKADVFFQKEIQCYPTSTIYCEYGHFLFQQQQFKEAIHYLQKAIDIKEIEKDDQDLFYGQLEKTVIEKYLQNIIEQTGEIILRSDLLAYYLLLHCYYQLNQSQSDEAISCLSKMNVVADEDEIPLVFRLLAHVYEMLGNHEKAETYFTKAEMLLELLSFTGVLNEVDIGLTEEEAYSDEESAESDGKALNNNQEKKVHSSSSFIEYDEEKSLSKDTELSLENNNKKIHESDVYSLANTNITFFQTPNSNNQRQAEIQHQNTNNEKNSNFTK